MNKNSRKAKLEKLAKQSEILKKVAEATDVNAQNDSAQYSEKIFNMLLSEIKIEGLEDD